MATFFIFIAYVLFDFTLFIIIALIEAGVAGVIAFIKINGMPFHFFLLNVGQTFRRPYLRVWNKDLDNAEIKALTKVVPPPPPRVRIIKEPLASTRLAELTLIVNTGGMYNPEE